MTQSEYIAILLNDVGVDTLAKRKAWLEIRNHGTDIDALPSHERSAIIDELKVIKAEKREAAGNRYDYDEPRGHREDR